jgi:PAS domain S-box-containing protein
MFVEVSVDDTVAAKVLRAMADCVFVLAVDGSIASVNDAAARLLGRGGLIGMRFLDVCADKHAATRSMKSVAYTGDELRREEIDLLAASGEVIPASVVATAVLGDDGFLEAIVLVARDLRETRRLVAELAAARDHLEARLGDTERQLVHAERLATLGTLAGGIGHELNNIAAIQMGTVELLIRCLPATGEHAELLTDLGRVGEHVSTHANRLLRLARPGPDYGEVIDLRDIVTATVSLLRGARKLRSVSVSTELGDDAVPVTVSRPRIEQILVNLVINAADALGKNGSIRIGVRREGQRAVCEVIDDGPGIDPAILEQIFEPFFTTKDPERGTGLGLVVARQIARSYGGDLRVESQPGQGARFWFDLPLGNGS